MTPEVEAEPPVAVLADAHFSEETIQKLDHFKALLERLPSEFATLIFLGDLFDLWIGINGTFPAYQAQVIDAVREVRKRGTEVYYVEGNRDYGIARIEGGDLFDGIIPMAGAFAVSDTKFLLAHGDLINRRDWRYRAWRGASRGLLVPLALRVLSPQTLLRLASKVEVAFRGTNAPGRKGFPRESCIAYARSCFERGFDAVIVGHFHLEEEMKLDYQGVPKAFFSVPSFKDTGRILVIGRDGCPAFQ